MPRLYVDLDGVLCDFEAGAERALGVPCALYRDLHGERAMWQRLARTPGYYEHLDWMAGGRDLWDGLRQIDNRPIVLTGLPLGNWAEVQKRTWCARELGPGVPVICCLSRDKPAYCSEGDVLIDDREEARSRWEGAGGVFVHHTDVSASIAAIEQIYHMRTEVGRAQQRALNAGLS